jgi:imidazolonepropionase-like amidohydrolase
LPNTLVALRSARIMRDMLMRGFTTVRDLGGADHGLVMEINEGLIEAPRLVICGKALSQTGGHTDYRGRYHARNVDYYADRAGALGRVVDGVDDVRRAAREEIKAGAQFVKIMANGGVSSPTDPIASLGLSADEVRAAVEEAHNAQTYVAAHLYTDEAIRRAVELGVESVEHGNRLCHGNLNRLAEARREGCRSSRCSRSPGVKCPAPEDAERGTGCEVTLGVEGVVDGGMNRQEALS